MASLVKYATKNSFSEVQYMSQKGNDSDKQDRHDCSQKNSDKPNDKDEKRADLLPVGQENVAVMPTRKAPSKAEQ
jgi:hypothetical protein